MAKKLMSVFGVQAGESVLASESSLDIDGDSVATDARNPASRPVMTLGKTLFFKGELSADEDLVLLGRLEGSINHSENLTVGAGGIVIGDMSARTITIKGTVEGDINAIESITLAPTANVLGDLTAPRVSIVEGAKFNGAVRMPLETVAATKTDTVLMSVSSHDTTPTDADVAEVQAQLVSNRKFARPVPVA